MVSEIEKEIVKPANQVRTRDEQGRWLPGVSGNPNGDWGGRPIGAVSLVTILKRRLYEHPEDSEAIIDSLVKMGRSRELGAIKEILDRIDGKVAETHRIEGELPIRIEFVPAQQLLNNTYDSQSDIKELEAGNG